jgi:hypothetical protein
MFLAWGKCRPDASGSFLISKVELLFVAMGLHEAEQHRRNTAIPK